MTCSAEHLARAKRRRDANPERYRKAQRLQHKRRPELRKGYVLKRTYGLTQQDYIALLKKQRGRCAACRIKLTTGRGSDAANIDHCHKTHRVRGILCAGCNRALGHAKEDARRLTKLAEYIRRHG